MTGRRHGSGGEKANGASEKRTGKGKWSLKPRTCPEREKKPAITPNSHNLSGDENWRREENEAGDEQRAQAAPSGNAERGKCASEFTTNGHLVTWFCCTRVLIVVLPTLVVYFPDQRIPARYPPNTDLRRRRKGGMTIRPFLDYQDKRNRVFSDPPRGDDFCHLKRVPGRPLTVKFTAKRSGMALKQLVKQKNFTLTQPHRHTGKEAPALSLLLLLSSLS